MQTEIRLERVSRPRAVLDLLNSKAALIQPRLLTPAASLRREANRQACFISPSAERPIVSRFDTRGKASEMTPKEPQGSNVTI